MDLDNGEVLRRVFVNLLVFPQHVRVVIATGLSSVQIEAELPAHRDHMGAATYHFTLILTVRAFLGQDRTLL